MENIFMYCTKIGRKNPFNCGEAIRKENDTNLEIHKISPNISGSGGSEFKTSYTGARFSPAYEPLANIANSSAFTPNISNLVSKEDIDFHESSSTTVGRLQEICSIWTKETQRARPERIVHQVRWYRSKVLSYFRLSSCWSSQEWGDPRRLWSIGFFSSSF